jgi:L-malate glycosyltransferase
VKKLLLVATNSIHTSNYLNLIDGYFDEVLVITNENIENYSGKIVKASFSLSNILSAFKTVKKIRTTIKNFSPSIVHVLQANSVAYLTFLAARKKSVPKILTIWGSDILVMPQKGFFYKKMSNYILNQNNYFITGSEYVSSFLKEKLSPKNIDVTVANVGIDFDFKKHEKEKIIYSNRSLEPIYQIEKIIAAFKFFSEKNSDWKLIIGGSGSQLNFLQKKTADLFLNDKIQFVGWLNKKQNRDFYNRASIYVSIPTSDAAAISLQEAMAAGCIPVVSDIPANHELIVNNQNGIIASDLNGDFISSAFILNAEEMKIINQQIVSQRSSKEINRKKFTDLYDRILQ